MRYQKLSTVIWPGLRRRCLRRPRSTSAAVASFSISRVAAEHDLRALDRAAAAAAFQAAVADRRRDAAGSEPGAASRLTKVT